MCKSEIKYPVREREKENFREAQAKKKEKAASGENPSPFPSIIEYRVFEHVYNFRQRPAMCEMVQYLISPTRCTHAAFFFKMADGLCHTIGIGCDKMKYKSFAGDL